MSDPTSTIEPRALRQAFGGFLTGVTVVTTLDSGGEPRGFTANSFTSVSLDPPLLLVCLDRRAGCFSAFMETGAFAVNVLSEEQRSISSTFASKQVDKFKDAAWTKVQGSPFLDGSLVSFACAVQDRFDAGDHVVIVGRVLELGGTSGSPLGFYSGNYVDFSLERSAMEARMSRNVTFGGVFEKDGKLLVLEEGGHASLPAGTSLGEDKREPGSLLALLDSIGVSASLDFVYSLFHDSDGHFHIYYTGRIEEGPSRDAAKARLVAVEDLKWSAFSDHTRHLLRRYINERELNQFGIFVGTERAHTVKSIGPDMRLAPSDNRA